ncbi:NtaA/DmoA family FMN-dependent monooxygenase [Brucella sp. NBRC 12950]|uniref:NtaA/DmoA family FMN-dependent monooxygenase n=1 Tax=Brucella sp. NBRC 12950 TaxID=2994518 RepID=UPI0024A4465F|nr:NtaA/DmoA family FMN-dependent monooxygenase [Brucella sp. NBRC 12950]GLU30009.1 monooxygenase [Brucella sp. NBRC 12950]
MNRQMKLGLTTWKHAYHVASWRLPESPRDAMWNIRHFIHNAQEAERGLFDFVFMADVAGAERIGDDPGYLIQAQGITRLEPMQVLAAMAVSTHRIGLVGTISTSYSHPYHAARAIATLDHISNGRAGWNIVTSHNLDEAKNFGLSRPLPSDERYRRCNEFVDVVRGLWDSWEDDAYPVDQAAGIYVDRSKMHYLEHEGEFFKVKGPLNLPRAPQGHPILVTAGVSEQGHELAARCADVIYAGHAQLDAGQQYYQSVKSRLGKHGRSNHHLSVLPGLLTFIGATEEEAAARAKLAQQQVRPEVALAMVSEDYGDLSAYSLDKPLPDDAPVFDPEWGNDRHRGPQFARNMTFIRQAHAEGKTLRQICEAISIGEAWNIILVGTPGQIVDRMQEWFEKGAADGFNVQPSYSPGNLTAFVNQVIPELQRRGLFRTRYEGETLRDHLGLQRPDFPKKN